MTDVFVGILNLTPHRQLQGWPVSAGLTDYARKLRVRAETEGILFGDWSFQVGTDGFDLLSPEDVTPVDYADQVLSAPVGGTRYLGRVRDSGAAGSVSVVGDGFVQIDGLAAIPSHIQNRWIRLSGSGDTALNGTWIISEYIDATSVVVYNPLATAIDAGPLAWELRETCILRPNLRAIDFHARLEAPDVTIDGMQLGQVGVFCRVIRSPADPTILGDTILFAVAHHPAASKFAELTTNYHICVQV